MMRLFIQGEKIKGVQLLETADTLSAADVVKRANELGVPKELTTNKHWVGIENTNESLAHDDNVSEEKYGKDIRVHCHRCHSVEVICNYNNISKSRKFPPSSTIESVWRWAIGHEAFNFSELDAADLVFETYDGSEQPGEHMHVGSLVDYPNCILYLNIVAGDRPQG